MSINANNTCFAAEYMRMSTDHQKYSLDNQSGYIREYAKKHNITIIRSYSDAGKSGLNLSGKPGLKALIDDVLEHRIAISSILVYDVSRFGRFQDTDEAGHYSHLLKLSGVKIIYCAEHFSEAQPEMFTLGLALSRHGAASFSRNQSEKVFLGQVNLIKKGYHQGGMAGYGLRRLLIDENHNPKGELEHGQRKSIQTDRVILTPGPREEINIVNRIFDMFNDECKPELVIASELNRLQVLAENGSCWSRAKVHQILTSEKYIGDSVYNKRSFKLKQQHVINPENEWVRYNGAYTPIVAVEKFNRANEIIRARTARLSEDELLDKLRALLRKKGRLSGIIIDEEELLPSSSIYRSRFGSLLRVYQLIGYTPATDYTWLKTRQLVNEFNDRSTQQIIDNISNEGGWISDTPAPGILHINDEFTLAIQSARCQRISPKRLRWKIKFRTIFSPDISIAVRMDSLNQSAVDYYIFPAIDILSEKISLQESNPYQLDLYRFDSLTPFYRLIRRTKLKD